MAAIADNAFVIEQQRGRRNFVTELFFIAFRQNRVVDDLLGGHVSISVE